MYSTSNLVARTLLLVRRHREEKLLDAAIDPVVGSFLSSSEAVACWVTNGELTLRFGIMLGINRIAREIELGPARLVACLILSPCMYQFGT